MSSARLVHSTAFTIFNIRRIGCFISSSVCALLLFFCSYSARFVFRSSLICSRKVFHRNTTAVAASAAAANDDIVKMVVRACCAANLLANDVSSMCCVYLSYVLSTSYRVCVSCRVAVCVFVCVTVELC